MNTRVTAAPAKSLPVFKYIFVKASTLRLKPSAAKIVCYIINKLRISDTENNHDNDISDKRCISHSLASTVYPTFRHQYYELQSSP